ncbi:MAG: cytochrome c3 family protein [Candidatus Anammoxibacter sp.]
MCTRIISLVSVVVFLIGFSSFNLVSGRDRMGDGNTSFTTGDNSFFSSFSKGRITGTILDRKGDPIRNATILVEEMEKDEEGNSSSFIRTVQTNSNGIYRVMLLPLGKYKVTAIPEDGGVLLSNDTFNVKVFAWRATVVDMMLSSKPPAGTGFVGSAACQSCHSGKHSAWSKSAHAKAHLVPAVSTIVAPFDDVVLPTSDEKVQFNAFITGDDYKVTLFDLNDNSVSITYDVVRTHGGVAHSGKQRFQVKLGNSHYILPVQYNHRNVDADNPNDAWVSYHPERWYNDDGTLREPSTTDHSFEQNCEGCHATGLSVTKVNDEFISSSAEIGIGCEECHGPGAIHVNTLGGRGNHIIHPDYMTVEAANQICGQCHTRVVSKPGDFGADFGTGYPSIVDIDEIIPYVAGNDLDKFLSFTKLNGASTPGFWNDNDTEAFDENASKNNHSKKHHQQAIDYTKSGHFLNVGLTCFDCHSPHGTKFEAQLRLNNDDNSLCLSCHTGKGKMGKDGVTNVHTKHPWDPEGSKASRCSGCHMPKTAKTAVYTDIHSHVFDIIEPPVSLAMAEKNDVEGVENGASTVVMNACFSCHPKDDFGVNRWEFWKARVVEE